MPKSNSQGGKKSTTTTEPLALTPIIGTDGDDLIDLNGGPNGPTTAGDDLVYGGLGNDTINGGGGNDELHGDEGIDVIDGGADNDIIYGGDGADILAGGTGNDMIYGDAGDDFIFGDPGSDTIDGGDGWDTVIYYGELDVDYSFSEITEVIGKGPNRETIVIGYEVTALDGSGDIDTLYNIEEVVFISAPPGGDIVTQSDAAVTRFDQDAVVNLLANDFIVGGELGEGLEVRAILDIQIDLDGDNNIDVDLIPDTATMVDFESGVLLNDGSYLYYDPLTDELTWDPNGVYDTQPAGDRPVIYFWYEVQDADLNTAFGDVAIAVSYGTPTGSMGFEYMGDTLYSILGLAIYADGPVDHYEYWVTQLSTAGGGKIEERDASVPGYDYDGDGDAEYRVWTDPNGTTHEMNVTHELSENFGISTVTFTGIDAGDSVTIEYYTADGYTKLGEDVVMFDELTPTATVDGVEYYIYNAGETDIGQFSVVAAPDVEVFVDDVVFV